MEFSHSVPHGANNDLYLTSGDNLSDIQIFLSIPSLLLRLSSMIMTDLLELFSLRPRFQMNFMGKIYGVSRNKVGKKFDKQKILYLLNSTSRQSNSEGR